VSKFTEYFGRAGVNNSYSLYALARYRVKLLC